MRHAVATKDWSADDFADALDGLDDELVNVDAYKEAVNYGRKTVPGTHRDENDPVADVWINHIRPYAKNVPGRVAEQLAETARSVEDDPNEIAKRINEKLEALRSSITRYAEPTWGAGQQGYGEELGANSVLIAWHLDDGAEHCDDCPDLAANGPYAKGDVPAWPGDGSTQCLDRCKCWIEADEDSWNAVFS